MTQLKAVVLLLLLAVGIASWGLTCAAARYDEVTAGFLTLETRRFERLTLVTLGTGGAHEDHNRRGPSTAVAVLEDVWLVDAGRGVAEGLRAARIPPSQPDVVALTSLLAENTVGLDDLLSASWLDGRRTRIRLLGPQGTARLARAVEAALAPGLEAWARAGGEPLGEPGFDVEEIADGWSLERGELQVRVGALPGGPAQALAYRFDWRGRSAVVSSAGWADEALARFARGANALLHEAAYIPTPQEARELGIEEDPEKLRRDAALHTTLSDVGKLAMRAGVEKLVLVRLRPPPVFALQVTTLVDDSFDGEVLVPSDGDEITP